MLSEELYIRSPKRASNMFRILYKYFIINKKVVLPGIGVFYIHRQPASFDFSNKTFISPSGQIDFTESDATADKKFYSFISKEQQIDEAEARGHFTDFNNSLKQELDANGMIEVPGFGSLKKDVGGRVQFKPARQLPSFFKDVAAERTIREVQEEQVTEAARKRDDNEFHKTRNKEATKSAAGKSYWWVFAIVLAVVAIAAIAFYYYQNGSLR